MPKTRTNKIPLPPAYRPKMTFPEPARRGRTALVCGLACYVAFQFAANFAADFVYPAIREPEYGRKLTLLQSQLAQFPNRPLLLVLGSSRTAYGIRPESLFDASADQTPLVYNFGILGGGPLYELMYFERLLAAGVKPQWVVVEVHPGLLKLSPEMMAGQVPPLERCDARDLIVLSGYLDQPADSWRTWLHYRSSAFFQFRSELMRCLAPGWIPAPPLPDTNALDTTTSCGWVPGPWPKPDDATLAARCDLVRHIYSPSYRQFEVSDRSNRALRQILDRCRQNGIATALLLMPEADELRDAEVTAAEEQIGRYLTALGREFDAPLIDASHWCASADFADGQHLLAEAAERLSVRLGEQVLHDWLALHGERPESTATIAARPRREPGMR